MMFRGCSACALGLQPMARMCPQAQPPVKKLHHNIDKHAHTQPQNRESAGCAHALRRQALEHDAAVSAELLARAQLRTTAVDLISEGISVTDTDNATRPAAAGPEDAVNAPLEEPVPLSARSIEDRQRSRVQPAAPRATPPAVPAAPTATVAVRRALR
jgi:hypothetical protein